MKKSNKKHAPLAFYLSVVLFLLTMLSTSLSSNILAKYSTGDSSYDSARVARFTIEDGFLQSNFFINIADIVPGEVRTIQFKIDNQSEVAVRFLTTSLNVTNNLPLAFAEIDIEIPAQTAYTISYAVSWPIVDNGGILSDSKDFAGKVELIEVLVTATQID